jgi:hypothetical protein
MKESSFLFIYTCKDEVIALKFELAAGGYDSGTEICRARYNFGSNDSFKILSSPFILP